MKEVYKKLYLESRYILKHNKEIYLLFFLLLK